MGFAAQVPLLVPAGVPLRLYVTKRIPKKLGAPVQARLLDPVWAFDRQVIPAGAEVLGRVSRIQGISGRQRAMTILNGDFTPLHYAEIEFDTIVMPDGMRLAIHTEETEGLNSIVPVHPRKPQPPPADPQTGVVAAGKRKAREAVAAQVDRLRNIEDVVRGPGKKDAIEDYLVKKLPYHWQYVRNRTRFDAELREPLRFGMERVEPSALAVLGTQPPPGGVGRARLTTPLDSATAKQGQPVEAVLAEPVFSAKHQLILPEGTRLEGSVAVARRARKFHRGGQLRFKFQKLELPEQALQLQETAPAPSAPTAAPQSAQKALITRTEATLAAAESGGKAHLKVDREGGVQAQESKTRFLAAAAALMVARSAGDNDAIRNSDHQVVGQSQNVGGRTIGGGFGFGLLGMGIAQSSRWVGTAFGYYGAAWALYSTLLARGSDVRFRKDAMIEIRFDTRAQPTAGKSGAR